MVKKAILIAGGKGFRLYPATAVLSKQLLPLYDKPMIYYALFMLMQLGIRDILIVTAKAHLMLFKKLLKTGSQFGLSLSYQAQDLPLGVTHALSLGQDFVGQAPFVVMLGDNFFYGHDLIHAFKKAMPKDGATLFAYPVADVSAYGAVFFEQDYPVKLIEKPATSEAGYAVTGFYYYDQRAFSLARQLLFSTEGEVDITLLNQRYLASSSLQVHKMDPTWTWFDLGSAQSLLKAAHFVAALEAKGIALGALEALAYQNHWISQQALLEAINQSHKSPYEGYLMDLLTKERR